VDNKDPFASHLLRQISSVIITLPLFSLLNNSSLLSNFLVPSKIWPELRFKHVSTLHLVQSYNLVFLVCAYIYLLESKFLLFQLDFFQIIW